MSKPWFYFGCGEYAGHHLHDESGHRAVVNVTWRRLGSFDGLLPPQDTSHGYLATVTRLPAFGVSALAFWDYSVDKRGGSNSVIFAPSMTITPEDLLAEAQRRFPWVFSRLPQAVVLHPIPSQEAQP